MTKRTRKVDRKNRITVHVCKKDKTPLVLVHVPVEGDSENCMLFCLKCKEYKPSGWELQDLTI